MDPKRAIPRHIIIKMSKIKDIERILKATRGNDTVTYKGVPIRLSTDFSKETLQATKERHKLFKMMKDKDLQCILLYTARLSFHNYHLELKNR